LPGVSQFSINILPRFKGRAVHDDLAAYFLYELEHAVCNAHHLRSLLFLLERYPQKWIEPVKDLLLKIKARVERAQGKLQTSLSTRQRNLFQHAYDQLIAQGLRANPPPVKRAARLDNADA
jgi:transposase